MRKNLARLLLLCFCSALLLSACSGTKDEKADPSSEETLLCDYDGAEIRIYNAGDAAHPFGYAENTKLADEVLQRLEDVGKKVNGTFTFFTPSGTFADYVNARIAASQYFTDILFGENSLQLRSVFSSGGFVPIDDVSDILDFHDHEKWGTVGILEALMYRGVLYGVSPQYWIGKTTIPYYSLVYNRELVCGEFGQADPHELYENKTWTRPALENYVLTCTAAENGSTRIYGLAASAMHIIRQAVLSNGCQMLETGADGEILCGWTTPLALEGLTWAQQFLTEHKDELALSGWDAIDPFLQNSASFLLTMPQWIVDPIAFELKDFGLMPWPSGPQAPYGEWVGYYEAAVNASIPADAQDVEGSAIAIDRIFEPMDEYPDFDAVKNYYTENVFRDPLDTEILFLNRDNPLTQFCYWPDGGDDLLYKLENIAFDAQLSPATVLEQNKSLLDKVIREEIYPNRQAIENYR